MDVGKSGTKPRFNTLDSQNLLVSGFRGLDLGFLRDLGFRIPGFSVGWLVAVFCLAGAAAGQTTEYAGLPGPASLTAPMGPGSYVEEPPHCRWPRVMAEKVGDHFRHRLALGQGLLEPVSWERWLYRPYSLGWFGGMMSGGELLEDWVEQRQGFSTGCRFGYDLDAYWGVETRLAWSWMRLADSSRARDAQQAADDALGIPPDDAYRDRFEDRDADLFFWDVDLVYYPCGDVPLRPYGLIGFGLMHISGVDRLDQPIHEMVHTLPLAIGLKHRPTPSMAVRLELADTLGFGDELETLHNLSIVAGIEFRFGGSRKVYWPWEPAKQCEW